jgi:uncharacterized caspase-like protein
VFVVSVALAALPDIDEPHRSGVANAADSAVIVGIEDYFVLPDVPYATRDAEAFYDFAVYTRGIPSDRVTLLTGPVSREKVASALTAAGKQTKAGGTVFVYFAGHGAASPSTGERILVGADAQADLETFQARAVTVADVRAWSTAGGGSAVLVLDTCYSGKSRSGGDVVAGKRFAVPTYALDAPPRVVEWTAAGPDQWSGPLDVARHGAFTYLAVGALRGWADGQRDGVRDGAVTVEEATLYVEEGLRTLQIRDQRPERLGDGTVVLSRGKEKAPTLTASAAVVAPAPAPVAAAPAPVVAYGTGPGQLQFTSFALVNLFVDGVFRPNLADGVVRIDDLSPGTHLVELRNALNRTVVSRELEVPPGTQVRLQYRDKQLQEIGRGPVDTRAAPPPVPVPAPLTTRPPAAPVAPVAPAPAAPPVVPPTQPPVSAAQLQVHLAAMDGIMMADDKVAYLAGVARNATFTCAQVATLIDAIAFSASQVAAVRALRGSVVDPQNHQVIVDVLPFQADQRQIRAIFQ